MDLNKAKEIFSTNKERYLNELVEVLKFKSISTSAKYREDCENCANWLKEYLVNLGFQSRLINTEGKPLVFAEYKVDSSYKTILFYGHYDVQPADVSEGWNSDPFNPVIKDDVIYARGAVDNKGQFMYVLHAIEYLIKENLLSYNLKVLLEGEEESASIGIMTKLPDISNDLKSDFLFVMDSGCIDLDIPMLTMGFRGAYDLEFIVNGPRKDLHSGLFGGGAPNPAKEISRLITLLHDKNGRIAIPGFYDNLKLPDKETLKESNKTVLTEKEFIELTGISPKGGEEGVSLSERISFQPTIEISGIYGGYQGEGSKTIIPSKAGCKLTGRLGVGQNKKEVKKIEKFLIKNINPEFKLDIVSSSAYGEAFSLPLSSEAVTIAQKAFKKLYNKEALSLWCGASIPILAELLKLTKNEAIMSGFYVEKNNMHGINENFSLEQYELGFCFTSLLLGK